MRHARVSWRRTKHFRIAETAIPGRRPPGAPDFPRLRVPEDACRPYNSSQFLSDFCYLHVIEWFSAAFVAIA
jgi:hypothetical protein